MTRVSTIGKFARCTLLFAIFAPVYGWGVSPMQATTASPSPDASPALALYHQLRSVGLDGQKVFHVRDADLDREDIHLSLTEGTIAFTQAVDGHVTGAFFEGEGEMLLVPANQTERASLALFTHAAVLEEKFATAYFRFNDAAYDELRSSLRPIAADEAQDFINRWNSLAQSMADADALRLLMAFSNPEGTRIFHARIGGLKLGTFDVNLDTNFPDQVYVAQVSESENGTRYYDLWTAFPMRSAHQNAESAHSEGKPGFFDISHYKISTHVLPSHELETETILQLHSRREGVRALAFELSRFLQLKSVVLNGSP